MIDLRIYKGKLRSEAKEYRRSLSTEEKEELDRRVFERLRATHQYRNCETIFIYASLPAEVDTSMIIADALESGRRVALPRCVKGTRIMNFYYINGIDDLEPGAFGVMEPKEGCECADGDDGLMIVPALCIDSKGYRLGYGGGYYDRYLSQFKGESIGICYYENFRDSLLHGRYDVPLNAVLTEKFVRRIKRG